MRGEKKIHGGKKKQQPKPPKLPPKKSRTGPQPASLMLILGATTSPSCPMPSLPHTVSTWHQGSPLLCAPSSAHSAVGRWDLNWHCSNGKDAQGFQFSHLLVVWGALCSLGWGAARGMGWHRQPRGSTGGRRAAAPGMGTSGLWGTTNLLLGEVRMRRAESGLREGEVDRLWRPLAREDVFSDTRCLGGMSPHRAPTAHMCFLPRGRCLGARPGKALQVEAAFL